ncbi:MAG: GNAT family N-acetyltransferase [Candidatus Micrarchaeota archaeon]|nr:GNAT family N-acetyltransferase [Candidatus Micrarchaeota archaeon]
MKETIALKDGRKVVVRDISPNEDIRALCKFANDIIEEDVYILVNKKVSAAEEKAWLKGQVEKVRKGALVHLLAQSGRRIVGGCEARTERGRESKNVFLGIIVSKDFRGAGLGEILLKKTIELAKKRLKPELIYLTHMGPNDPARRLYEKTGFREVARLPKWTPYRGKRLDRVYMVLKK